MIFFEREALRKVAVSAFNAAAAYAVAHVSGHYGVTIDPTQFAAALFVAAEYARHLLAAKFPAAAPWIS